MSSNRVNEAVSKESIEEEDKKETNSEVIREKFGASSTKASDYQRKVRNSEQSRCNSSASIATTKTILISSAETLANTNKEQNIDEHSAENNCIEKLQQQQPPNPDMVTAISSELSDDNNNNAIESSNKGDCNYTSAKCTPLSNSEMNAGRAIENARPKKQAKSHKSPADAKVSHKDPLGAFRLSTSPINMFMNNKVSSSSLLAQNLTHPNVNGTSNNGINQLARELAPRASSSSSSSTALQLASQFPVTRRQVRDSGSFLFLLAYLAFLVYIIWEGFSSREANVQLIIHGHDSYGNICGQQNKPIRFVEKSGKNYTSKPITKYTLINAQFERYVLLDHDHLHQSLQLDGILQRNQWSNMMNLSSGGGFSTNQEFYYVKESLMSSAKRASQNLQLPRSPRSLEPVVKFDDDDENNDRMHNKSPQTLLKSSLMYQYPPRYQSVSMEAPMQRGREQSPLAGSFTEVIALPSPRTTETAQSSTQSHIRVMINGKNSNEHQLQQQQPRSTNAWQRNLNSAPLATVSDTAASAISPVNAQQDDLVSSQSIASAASVNRTSVGLPLGHVAKPARGGLLENNTTSNELDSNANNNLDHVLISRTQLKQQQQSTGSRIPDILSQSEASQQLLYLTECVDSCPADHLELVFFRCLPKNWRFSLFPNAINVTRTFIDDLISDIGHCHRELIYTFSFALVLSVILLILLRFLASFIIWASIGFLITLLTSTAAYSWINYYYQIVDLNVDSIAHESASYADRLALSDKWLIGSIFLTFMSLAGLVTVIFMRRRILLVTTLFRESGKAIADMPMLLLQPLLTFTSLILIVACWCIAMVYLQSIKQPVIDRTTGLVVYRSETLYKVMKWYHIFAFLWVSHFAIACQHYVIGASVTKWYFSSDRYRLASPIGSSVSELILYYLGSVALGSFLVAVFKVIRIITKQIQFLIQKNCITSSSHSSRSSLLPDSLVGGNSATAAATTTTSSCCGSLGYVWRLFIWFFDKIVVIISRDAYVEIAIHGDSFLTGAQRAFNVLASNPLRLLAIKTVSSLLLTISKICVVFGTISMATLLIEEKSQILNYSWSPIVISAMFAYVVAHWFLSVYEMVIDALFICYCEDYERSKFLGEIIAANGATIGNSRALIGSQFMSRILNSNNVHHQLY